MGEGRGPGRPRDAGIDDRILDAATELLEKQGFSATSMEGVARRAGIAKQTLYRRYASRQRLLLGVLGRIASTRAPPVDRGSLVEDLGAVLRPAFRFAHSSAGHAIMRAVLTHASEDSRFASVVRDEFIEPRRAVLIQAVERAKVRGELAATMDSSVLCDGLWGAMWYRLAFEHASLEDDVVDRLIAAIVLPPNTKPSNRSG
ncbi:MAG: TetR/AcrR family transcriptional regulator [Myxococcota bacterium]